MQLWKVLLFQLKPRRFQSILDLVFNIHIKNINKFTERLTIFCSLDLHLYKITTVYFLQQLDY